MVADMGYYHGAEVKKCEAQGIVAYVAKPNTSANTKLGLFGSSIRSCRRLSYFENGRQGRLGPVRGTVAGGIPVDGCLQQNGEAARLRCIQQGCLAIDFGPGRSPFETWRARLDPRRFE